MCRKALDLLVEGIDDELNVTGWNSLDCFLDNMIAVLVLDAFQHVILEFLDDASLLVNQHMFQCLRFNMSVKRHRK